jgi:transcription antitermination factor NusG
MSRLKKEAVINPEDLLADRAEAVSLYWWIAFTCARCEKAVARALVSKNCKFVLPMVTIEDEYARKGKACYRPLYPGYLFLAGQEPTLDAIYPLQHLTHTEIVKDKESLVEHLCLVWKFMMSRRVLRQEASALTGQKISVVSGPLSGMQGTLFTDQTERKRLVVPGVGYGYAVSIELTDDDIVQSL